MPVRRRAPCLGGRVIFEYMPGTWRLRDARLLFALDDGGESREYLLHEDRFRVEEFEASLCVIVSGHADLKSSHVRWSAKADALVFHG